MNEAKTCEPDVIWIGDSIIQQLQFSDLWDKISSLHCLNFGIGGDRVENVLWRLQNGELECSSTVKIIVLFVGTNNYNSKAEEIVEGIEECIQVIRKKLGHCHIVIPVSIDVLSYWNFTVAKLYKINSLKTIWVQEKVTFFIKH